MICHSFPTHSTVRGHPIPSHAIPCQHSDNLPERLGEENKQDRGALHVDHATHTVPYVDAKSPPTPPSPSPPRQFKFLFCIARKPILPSLSAIPTCGAGDQGVKIKRKCHADFRVHEIWISFPTDRPTDRGCHAKGKKTIQHKFNKTEGEGVAARERLPYISQRNP